MTTEAVLRNALTDLVDDYDGVEDMLPPECLQKILAARAALALPPTEVRKEYRANYILGGCEQRAHACDEAEARELATCLDGKVSIESRTAAGPWLPLEAKS